MDRSWFKTTNADKTPKIRTEGSALGDHQEDTREEGRRTSCRDTGGCDTQRAVQVEHDQPGPFQVGVGVCGADGGHVGDGDGLA